MTPDGFRRLALALPQATEASHMAHPDFRVAGKIFATLGYPTVKWGVVKLMHLSARSHRVMTITKLLTVFDAFDSEEQAIAAFAATQH